jgi:hypothetical protein
VFLLFGRVCAGLRGAALREAMRAHGAQWPEIEAAVELASPMDVAADPVVRVFIHGVKGRHFDRGDLDERVVPTRAALQAALVLRALDRVDRDAPRRVADDLRAHGVDDEEVAVLCRDAASRLDVPDVSL